MNKVLVCIDGLNLSKVLLNVIEDSHISKKINLSRNIGLGYKDDLLDELDNEENS
jgi:hypothetical protein